MKSQLLSKCNWYELTGAILFGILFLIIRHVVGRKTVPVYIAFVFISFDVSYYLSSILFQFRPTVFLYTPLHIPFSILSIALSCLLFLLHSALLSISFLFIYLICTTFHYILLYILFYSVFLLYSFSALLHFLFLTVFLFREFPLKYDSITFSLNRFVILQRVSNFQSL